MKHYAIMTAPMTGGIGSGAYLYFFKKRKINMPDWVKQGLWKHQSKQQTLKLQRIADYYTSAL